MENKVPLEEFKTKSLNLFGIGPPLSVKAKTILYFSLSGKDSLTTLPFAKPAQLLAEKGYRVISATLPGHEENQRPLHIKSLWEENTQALENFFFDFENALIEISDQIDGPLSALGLSRGGYIATHLAARIDQIESVVGFAPLTYLEKAPELDLIHLAPKLKNKKILYTIGHNDTMVDTQTVIKTANSFINELGASGLQNSTIQLIITPSIGRDGHGTSEKTFSTGVDWVVDGT